jgi:hypothetical protein
MLHFVFVSFNCFSDSTAVISSNSINQLIFVMAKSSVFFAVGAKFLHVIYMIFGLKGLQSRKILALPDGVGIGSKLHTLVGP